MSCICKNTGDFSFRLWYIGYEVKPVRLLYAEDEKSLARAVSTVLIRNNYSVDVVHDGESALDYLATGNYDGVILDVMMPKLDGFEVLRRMRAQGDSTPLAFRIQPFLYRSDSSSAFSSSRGSATPRL